MGKLNKVMLIGNFGDAIQMHHFDGGNCIGRVSLATTETYKNKEGEKVENVEWHNLTFRNKSAEIVEKYTKKGSKLYIEGRLKYRKWEDKEGIKRYSTEIHVNEFEFLTPASTEPNKTSSSGVLKSPLRDENGNDLPF